ncbi:MAG TPA: hypothetical protein VN132_16500, partial [Bdellovibrio sp.]|nr:hypothetical protein [Bdellovibrio sp.]
MFLKSAEQTQKLRQKLKTILKEPNQANLAGHLSTLSQLLQACELDNLGENSLIERITQVENNLSAQKELAKQLQLLLSQQAPIEAISLATIVDASRIIHNTPRTALELRASSLSKALAHTTLQQGAELATKLKKQREQLQEIFSLNTLPNESEILNHISQLTSANLFSFFNADYKRAKRFYLTLCKHKWMGNEAAVSELRMLLDFIAQSQDFESLHGLKALIGNHFNGIDTQFEPFIALANFYQSLEQQISNPETSQLKTFIEEAPIAAILAFPQPQLAIIQNPAFQDLSLNSLNVEIPQLETQLDLLKANTQQIQQYATLFHVPSQITREELPVLTEQVKQLSILWANLACNNTIKNMLGEAFMGAETRHEKLDRALAIAETACHLDQDLRNVLLHILENRQTERLAELRDSIEWKTQEQLIALESLIHRAQVLEEDKPQFIQLYTDYKKLYEAAEDKTGLEAYRNL